MKLVIGNRNYSSWSLRPWFLMSFHGLPFEEERIPLDQDTTRAALARYSDAGKVPVLVDGELTVWDSLAICEYVSERYLDGRGWPDDIRARALARSCSAEMHSGFPEIRGRLPMNVRATGRRVPSTPALEREVARIDRMWLQCREEWSVHGPWLFGGFSIADCMFAPVAFRFETYGVRLSDDAERYRRFVLEHEALREWIQQAAAETEVIDAEETGN